VRLPRLLVVTDRTQAAGPLPDVVAEAVAAGARAVVLRDRDLPADERAALAAELRSVLDPVDGLLVTAGAGGDGAVHLAAAEPFPDPRPPLVGRSCHSAAELRPLGPPAYALGGVGPDDVPALLAAGAAGVAVMGPVMRDPSVVGGYLAALDG
jgi:thiamine monophosphate synthase